MEKKGGVGIFILMVLIILLLVGGGFLIYSIVSKEKIDVSGSDPWDLYDYAVEQKEVKNHVGPMNGEETYDVSQAYSFSEQGPINLYTIISDVKPECLEKISIGDVLRVVTIYTPSKKVHAIYSAETDKLICTLSYSAHREWDD